MTSSTDPRGKSPRVERPLAVTIGNHDQTKNKGGCGPSACGSEGVIESRNKLIQANLGLVHRVARQYVNRGLTLDDLIGEGNLGLIRAAEQYNPSLGTRFSTYATYWIRDAIVSGLANTGATIRLPINVSKLLGRWRRTEKALGHLHGHSPTFEEVAAAMQLDRPTQQLVATAHRVASLKDAADPIDFSSPTLRMLDEAITPEDMLTALEEREAVSRWFAGLEGTDRAIVYLRYGLSGERPMGCKRIAGRLGVSRYAVEKTVSTAMEELGQLRESCVTYRDPIYGSRVG
jgi:RNA polymerase primary sigma factor